MFFGSRPWSDERLVLKGKSPKNKILSTAARKAIRAALETNVYDGRKEKQKPSYMAPSADPADYSMVCGIHQAILG